MVYCKVVDCKSNSDKVKVSWHHFPHEPALRRQWIARLNRQNYVWKPSHRICGLHFRDPEDFISPSPQQALKYNYPRRRHDLVSGTVPSLQLGKKKADTLGHSSSAVSTKKPRMGAIKRQNLQVSLRISVCNFWIHVELVMLCLFSPNGWTFQTDLVHSYCW